MKKVKGMPITASRTSTSKKSPFVPDAKETSADEQTMIKEPPTPFKNNQTAAQAPAGTGVHGAVPGPVKKPWAGLQHSSPGAKALPNLQAAGQRRPINQSGQVNGRMGTRFPKRHRPNGAGFPSKRNASFYGE
jgi:hypothetical protein